MLLLHSAQIPPVHRAAPAGLQPLPPAAASSWPLGSRVAAAAPAARALHAPVARPCVGRAAAQRGKLLPDRGRHSPCPALTGAANHKQSKSDKRRHPALPVAAG